LSESGGSTSGRGSHGHSFHFVEAIFIHIHRHPEWFAAMLQPARDEHFVRKFAAQMKRSIISVPSKTMEMLVRWGVAGQHS
jgi:hypothetical protein